MKTNANQEKPAMYDTNFTIRGLQVDTAGTRVQNSKRYVTVALRPEPYTNEAGVYVAFAYVLKTTDSPQAANKAAAEYQPGPASLAVVIDRETGVEL